jgi:hypothetical protein
MPLSRARAWRHRPAENVMNAPSRQDLDQAMRYAQENIRLGDAAGDQAERHGRYVQALGNAARIMDALAGAIAPAKPAQGLVINFGAPGHPAVFAPGPR